MQDDFNRLVEEVAREGTVIDSAVTAFTGLEARIAALETTATDAPTAERIRALADSVGAQSDALAAAIASIPADGAQQPPQPPEPPALPTEQPGGGQPV